MLSLASEIAFEYPSGSKPYTSKNGVDSVSSRPHSHNEISCVSKELNVFLSKTAVSSSWHDEIVAICFTNSASSAALSSPYAIRSCFTKLSVSGGDAGKSCPSS